MKNRAPKRWFVVALVAGFAAVPVLAIASGLVLAPGPHQSGRSGGPNASLLLTPVELRGPTVVPNPVFDLEADLADACGPAGLALVAQESEGTISPLQQGALDALRDVCADEGLPLPAKSLEPEIVEVVVVEQVAPSHAPTFDEGSGQRDDAPDDDEPEEEDDDDSDEGHD